MPSLEGVFKTLAYVRFFREMPFRVGLLLEDSCFTPMPKFLCHHLLGTLAASSAGSEAMDRGGWWHQGPAPAPGSIPEGSQQWEVARFGLSSPSGLSQLHFGEYPAGCGALGKPGILQALLSAPCETVPPLGSGILRSPASTEEQGTAFAAGKYVQS